MYDYGLHGDALERWRQYNDQKLANPELITLGILRETYPGHHVTFTKPSRCDLLGFAEAGHATATQQDSPFDHALRIYEAPGYRLDKGGCKVQDRVFFGCWSYTWNGTDYFVYQAEYKDRMTRDVKLLYVLHPDGQQQRTNAATDALLLESGKWTKELHGEIYVFDNAEWKKSKELWKSVAGASWDDVILDADMKASLIDDVTNFFDTQALYHSMKVPWKRGVILHGVPGNGKTISVKALINSLAARKDPVPSLYVKSLDACAGPKWAIQTIFVKARTMAPCLLIFEDLDSMVTNKTRSYFLNEVDGLESNEGILMIGSTNYLDRLDAAITKRPSRFDRKYHFKLPNEAARAAYVAYWSHKFTGSGDVDFPESLCPIVAKMTDGFSFSYLKELFVASLLTLARGTSNGDIIAEEDEPSAGQDGDSDSSPPASDLGPATTPAAAAAAGNKKVLPRIDIPAELQRNVLLRILKKHAAGLLAEMDNGDEGTAPKEVPADDGEPPLFSAAWFACRADPNA
ncbi:proteasome-activating nucleotidase [Lasiosphaeria miniovina]|uniref:Proteasome-activating nucleotidase n=1 Tax=Lasiosphaeria miniovina TaxID=1954250 RepID=A0AA40AD73_9PEZI|nr:proteasome-activating nucleotidase [Lasiosphaeria miniovina]KAK0713759.1 proteasome-activating nucleotidase [Lasiosphaeria miniovina]